MSEASTQYEIADVSRDALVEELPEFITHTGLSNRGLEMLEVLNEVFDRAASSKSTPSKGHSVRG